MKKYLSQKVPFPPTGTFVPSNRLYPDVSAFGSRILVVSGGSISVSAGTSASTPIIAGIMTLINEARFLAGKTQIGFFNPALYTMYEECPQCFNRIASGNNRKSKPIFECCRISQSIFFSLQAALKDLAANTGELTCQTCAKMF